MRLSTTTAFHLREMVCKDIPCGLRLCRACGWNQLERDWRFFLDSSPGGCGVAVTDGEVAGTVATLRYENRFAWVSMVLVDPAVRGQGIGSGLLDHALQILGDVRSVRLDATPQGRMVYQKLGFHDEYPLCRMQAVSPSAAEPPVSIARPITAADLHGLAGTDCAVFGANRGRLLDWLLEGAPEYGWVLETGDGYMLGRHGYSFEHLGPIVATSVEAAQALVSACLPAVAGRPVVIDAPMHSAQWKHWLESLGFVEQRPFVRMFRGENAHPGLPEKQFAIAGPEFG
ncbi:MAG: GNAT family N-acetyltransferase [Acidobacteria bacterium]|nr:GNAT family N-acetyltransferase [Acidobacteriota bacterium]